MPAGSRVWPTANDVQTWYMGKQKDHCWYRNRLKHQKGIDNWALGSNIALNELPITHNNRWGKNWTSNYSSWIESFIRKVVWFRIWSARLPFTHTRCCCIPPPNKTPNTFTTLTNQQFFACQGFSAPKSGKSSVAKSLKSEMALLRAWARQTLFGFSSSGNTVHSYPKICLSFGRDDVMTKTLMLLTVSGIGSHSL